MTELGRTIRFAVGPAGAGVNGYGGVPAPAGLSRHYEITAWCAGEPASRTGYLADIKSLDAALRERIVPLVARTCETAPQTEPAALMPALFAAAWGALPASLSRLRWALSPTYHVEMESGRGEVVLVRQQFEFAASHRLHVPALSDEENRRLFGKCNHPSGHGHNYRVEPCVEVRAGPGAPGFSIADLEALVDETIIRPFDHRHLNVDTTEFGPGGLNPTVEHIARVLYERLRPAVEKGLAGARLREVTVWESDRTSATYPG
jgi:6-pyruvoyltetrahydropterin/6-carboxytetrahydropterin synthase